MIKVLFFLVLTTFAFAKDYNFTLINDFDFNKIECNLSCFSNNIPIFAEAVIHVQKLNNNKVPLYIDLPKKIPMHSMGKDTVFLANFEVEGATIKEGMFYIENPGSTIKIKGYLEAKKDDNVLNGYFSGNSIIEILENRTNTLERIAIHPNMESEQVRNYSVVSGLNFGKITTFINCSLIVEPDSTYTTNCDTVDGIVSAGTLSGIYTKNSEITSIELPEKIYLQNENGSKNTVMVNNFKYTIDTPQNDGDLLYINIGATLNIGAEKGIFSGFFPIIINY